MEDWNLIINLAWPHERFMIGWEFIQGTDEDETNTIGVYLGFIYLGFNFVRSSS